MKYKTIILIFVEDYIDTVSDTEKAKITVAMGSVASGDFQSIYTKQLQGDIRELKIKRHRLIFFIKNEYLYFVGAFLKKTMKTPKKEIESALNIYKKIT